MKKRSIFTLAVFALSLFSASSMYADKAKLTVWGIDIPDDDPNHTYAKALVTTFQAKYPDIQLDWVALGNDPLKDKVKVTMASGSGLPDVMQGWGGSVMGGYADAGQLLDISAAAKKYPDLPGRGQRHDLEGQGVRRGPDLRGRRRLRQRRHLQGQ